MIKSHIQIVGGFYDGKVIAIKYRSAPPEKYILPKPPRPLSVFVKDLHNTEKILEDIENITYVNTGRFKNDHWLFKEEGAS